NWRRVLHFAVPVRRPELWSDRCVNSALVAALSFLTEDEYHFRFASRRTTDPTAGYGLFRGGRFGGGVGGGMLFSGGLDSLAGAVQECVCDRHRVALVNHRSNPKIAPVLNGLVRDLRDRAQGAAPTFIPVRVHKVRELTRDRSQRARSFLFVALG